MARYFDFILLQEQSRYLILTLTSLYFIGQVRSEIQKKNVSTFLKDEVHKLTYVFHLGKPESDVKKQHLIN